MLSIEEILQINKDNFDFGILPLAAILYFGGQVAPLGIITAKYSWIRIVKIPGLSDDRLL